MSYANPALCCNNWFSQLHFHFSINRLYSRQKEEEFSSCDREFRLMTSNFELNLDTVKMNHRRNIWVKSHLINQTHTPDQTDCSTWTTKTVGNKCFGTSTDLV